MHALTALVTLQLVLEHLLSVYAVFRYDSTSVVAQRGVMFGMPAFQNLALIRPTS